MEGRVAPSAPKGRWLSAGMVDTTGGAQRAPPTSPVPSTLNPPPLTLLQDECRVEGQTHGRAGGQTALELLARLCDRRTRRGTGRRTDDRSLRVVADHLADQAADDRSADHLVPVGVRAT